ncbi:MAG: tRNA (adenosine(37)-N6)-threonylcarbamoyltransferase complex dimerization subunit type 1 TsaB, partial [Pseudomonadales bacterium]
MKLLAIDTSSDACSVAVQLDDEMLLDHRLVPQQHAQLLLPMIDELMTQAGLSAAQLDALVFGTGPG